MGLVEDMLEVDSKLGWEGGAHRGAQKSLAFIFEVIESEDRI